MCTWASWQMGLVNMERVGSWKVPVMPLEFCRPTTCTVLLLARAAISAVKLACRPEYLVLLQLHRGVQGSDCW